jgi:hypothetical protein
VNPQDGWTTAEALGIAISLGLMNDYDSMEVRREGTHLQVTLTKTLLPALDNITFNLSAAPFSKDEG